MWFKELTGFEEKHPDFVRENMEIQEEYLVSKANKEKFCIGNLEVPTLRELRNKTELSQTKIRKTTIKEIVADVQKLHADPKNENAIFQAASQFNLLEMVGPHITPEQGVDRYEFDKTQGPACAIACGAGTIYRNYFAEVNNQIGQSAQNQIDCLDLIGKELNNDELNLWSMENGYALVNQAGLLTINKVLANLNNSQREELKGKLKVGIQWNTEVTISKEKHKVTQVYCSALPVAYSHIEAMYWESFARIILEATYEATLCAAMLNKGKTGSNLVYLTLVGGGAFGNEEEWIFDSLLKSVKKFEHCGLHIRVVSYGKSKPRLVKILEKMTD